VRLWNSNTYRLETTLNYGMERGWAVAVLKNSNLLALGFDTGIVTIKVLSVRSIAQPYADGTSVGA